MGINQLRLSAELIAALYPESLVHADGRDPVKKPQETKKEAAPAYPDYPFLGKNLRSICFLVYYPDNGFIPDEQLAFLQKILIACKCSLDDIALINTAKSPVIMDKLKRQFNPRIIFLWGDPPAVTGMQQKFPDMSITVWENISILPVLKANLMSRDIPENTELKRNLWISLKKLFRL